MLYVVRREDTGQFLGPRSYGVAKWAPDLQSARTFTAKSPAKNAFTAAFPWRARSHPQGLPEAAVLPVTLALKD